MTLTVKAPVIEMVGEGDSDFSVVFDKVSV